MIIVRVTMQFVQNMRVISRNIKIFELIIFRSTIVTLCVKVIFFGATSRFDRQTVIHLRIISAMVVLCLKAQIMVVGGRFPF